MERSGMIIRESQSAVGISISLDKLVQAVQELRDTHGEILKINCFYCAICSLGRKPLLKEKTKVSYIHLSFKN